MLTEIPNTKIIKLSNPEEKPEKLSSFWSLEGNVLTADTKGTPQLYAFTI
jgi:hypothetical protein